MADREFDRTVFNTREKPLSVDLNQLQSQHDRSLRAMVRQMLSSTFWNATQQAAGLIDFATQWFTGFMGDGFKVRSTFPATMNVYVSGGYGFVATLADEATNIGGIQGVNDLDPYKPLVLELPQTFTVPANSSGVLRHDIIEVNYSRRLENSTSRETLDPALQQFVAGNVNKTLAFDNEGRLGQVTMPAVSTADISYKVGTGGSRPAVTPGYVKLADIAVPSGVTAITTAHIGDERNLIAPNNEIRITGTVTVPRNNPGKPTELTVHAPPGVEVVAYSGFAGDSDLGAIVEIMVLAGAPTQLAFGRAHVVTPPAGGIAAGGIPILATDGNGTVPIVRRLNGAVDLPLWTDASYTYPMAHSAAVNAGLVVYYLGAVCIGPTGTLSKGALPASIQYEFEITLIPQSVPAPAYNADP
jgi:uncharacterized protein YaiE (UPF0345 family)